MNLIAKAQVIFKGNVKPLTKLEKEVIDRLPDDWFVFRLKQQGNKIEVELLARQTNEKS